MSHVDDDDTNTKGLTNKHNTTQSRESQCRMCIKRQWPHVECPSFPFPHTLELAILPKPGMTIPCTYANTPAHSVCQQFTRIAPQTELPRTASAILRFTKVRSFFVHQHYFDRTNEMQAIQHTHFARPSNIYKYTHCDGDSLKGMILVLTSLLSRIYCVAVGAIRRRLISSLAQSQRFRPSVGCCDYLKVVEESLWCFCPFMLL